MNGGQRAAAAQAAGSARPHAGAGEDPVTRWVRRVNALGREMDGWAGSMHPGAWPDALTPHRREFLRLAASGPVTRPSAQLGLPLPPT